MRALLLMGIALFGACVSASSFRPPTEPWELEGIYYPTSRPAAVAAFGAISLTSIPSNEPAGQLAGSVLLASRRGQRVPDQLAFASITRVGDRLVFETVERDGIRFHFSGRFLCNPRGGENAGRRKIVLSGTLVEARSTEVVGTAELRFTYDSGY